MTTQEALSREAGFLHRDVRLMDSAALAGDVLIVIYQSDLETAEGRLRETRFGVYVAGQQAAGGIVNTEWVAA